MKNRIILVLFTTLFLFSTSSFAQVFLPPPPPVPNMSNVIWNNYMINQMGIQAVGQSIGNSQMTAAKAKNKKSATLQVFSNKLAFKASGYSLLAEKLLQTNNQNYDKKQLNDFFDGMWRNYLTTFKEENQRLGIPLEDVATAFTYYVVNNYMIAKDLSSLEAEKSLAVYRQISTVFLNNPDVLKMSANDKELAAEIFVSIGGIPTVILQTTNDKSKAKEAAQQNLQRIFGTKTAQLKITENGIEF